MLRANAVFAALLFAATLAAGNVRAQDRQDLFFGEAIYYAHQGLYFEALERLDAEVRQHADVDEPELDSLFRHMADARFSLGDFELRYRMHHRAGRAIRAVLEAAVDDRIRNDAAYRLARIHFQKGQMADAMQALARIDGEIPENIRDDVDFLRANILLAQGQPGEAFESLSKLEKSDDYAGFAAYNLGIALFQSGQQQLALQQLDIAGSLPSEDPAELAIRDKSNLVAASILIDSGDYKAALPYLNRVRLDGPFSNRALLSAGWASMSDEDFERAVVPWGMLADREVTDAATQEAMLALPYAYGKLDVHGRAAILYGKAMDSFGTEVDKLNESIESIRAGKFLEALIREEIRNDKDWVLRLRSLPETPETYYMMELLASHDFQAGLQNYLDLADLRRKLVTWQKSFDSFDDILLIRNDHYEPLLPLIDTEFRELDSRMRLRIEQHKMLIRRRDDLLTTPRPEFLATREEQAILTRLQQLEDSLLASESASREGALERIRRLRGTITWTIQTEYHQRFTEFDRNLRSLDGAMAELQAQYDQFVRARQAATHSYVGYDKPLQRLRVRISGSIDKVDLLMARQGRELEIAAIDQLMARRDRLEDYRDKARFALADSYDRATQSQAQTQAQLSEVEE